MEIKTPYLQIENYDFNNNIIDLIPEEISRAYKTIAVDCIKSDKYNLLTICMSKFNQNLINILERKLNCLVRVFLGTEKEIIKAINNGYINKNN